MDQYLGEIRNFGFNFPPKGWAICAGQLLSIQANSALFSLLGTYYGGNGTTNFALPDLRSRVPINQGQGHGLTPRTIGEIAGEEAHTLITQEMPMHNHMVSANASADSATPAATFPANDSRSPSNIYNTTSDGTLMNQAMIGRTGGNLPHNNIEPYLGSNFCIALTGIYPSRS
jgi:microcystin-dependent protein